MEVCLFASGELLRSGCDFKQFVDSMHPCLAAIDLSYVQTWYNAVVVVVVVWVSVFFCCCYSFSVSVCRYFYMWLWIRIGIGICGVDVCVCVCFSVCIFALNNCFYGSPAYIYLWIINTHIHTRAHVSTQTFDSSKCHIYVPYNLLSFAVVAFNFHQ